MPHEKPENVPEVNPLISVIVPTFNAAAFLPEAIESVGRQDYKPLEIIVVDDGSTDDTRSVAARWPHVRYIHQHNQGPSGARNTGIQAATADILAFLDVDDLWTADHLEALLPTLLAEPELRFVWGTTRCVRIAADSAGNRMHTALRDNVPLFLIGATLFRRSAFVEVGTFDPALRMGEDTDWLAVARMKCTPQKQIDRNVLIYRERAGSLTDGRKNFEGLNTMAILQRSIRRHRANQQSQAAAQGNG